MIFKQDNLQVNVVTVIRLASGEMLVDHATLEEAQRLGTLLFHGKIRWVDNGFMINDTTHVKGSNNEQYDLVRIAWFEQGEPFFHVDSVVESDTFKQQVREQELNIYTLSISDIGVGVSPVGDSVPHVDTVRYLLTRVVNKPAIDLNPSIPEELEVEKDEQLSTLAKLDWLTTPAEFHAKRPVWLREDGTVDHDVHRAECDELSRLYPNVSEPLDLSEAAQIKLGSTIRAVGCM